MHILGALFRGESTVDCPDAADANDDGALNLTDAVAILVHLFAGAPAPPAPGALACGTDPTLDDLAECVAGCRR